jgi:DNA polymerase-4
MNHGIFHIDLDAFFVSVEQIYAPELRGKPVIVGGQPDRRGVVAAASYEARAFGVKSAMPLSRAYRLCPKAIFLQGNYARYREASEKFMAILSEFSPAIEPAGLDEAYMDITGCDMFGPPRQMAQTLKERVRRELHLIASIGISQCKVVAKIASDLEKPDGLVEVPAGKEKEFLAPLSIERLPGVGKKTGQVLRDAGIKTIGQLAALPEPWIKSRLGSAGIMLHRYANGIDNRKIEEPGEAKSISHETTLAEDTTDVQELVSVLRYLCERVGARLRRREKRAGSVSLKLRYDDFETLNRSRSLDEATSTDDVIFATARDLLERTLGSRGRRVRLIGVEVSHLVGKGMQLSLFDAQTQQAQRRERLDKAVDLIRKKYGFDSIRSGRTLALREIFEPKHRSRR